MTPPPRRRLAVAVAALAAAGLVSGCDADVDVHVLPDGATFEGTFWSPKDQLSASGGVVPESEQAQLDGCTPAKRYLGRVGGPEPATGWQLTPIAEDPAHPGRLGCHVVGTDTQEYLLGVQTLDGRYVVDGPPSVLGQLFGAHDTVRVALHFPGPVVEASDGLKVSGSTAVLDDPFVGFKGIRVVARGPENGPPLPVLAGLTGLAGVVTGTGLGWWLGGRRPLGGRRGQGPGDRRRLRSRSRP